MGTLGEEEIGGPSGGRACRTAPDHPHMVLDRPGDYAVDVGVEEIVGRWDVAAVDGEHAVGASRRTVLPLPVAAIHAEEREGGIDGLLIQWACGARD